MRSLLAFIGAVLTSSLLAQTYTISTMAGSTNAGNTGDNGPAVDALLSAPNGLALDPDGNIFFTELGNNSIRRIDAVTGVITHVAGLGSFGYSGDGGPASMAGLTVAHSLAVGPGGLLFLSDRSANRIRVIEPVDGTINTYAGTGDIGHNTGVLAPMANINSPGGLCVAANGDLYYSQFGAGEQYVGYVDADSLYVHEVAGTGQPGFNGNDIPATSAQLNTPSRMAIDNNSDLLFCDVVNNRVRKVDRLTGLISTVVGTGTGSYNGDGIPATSANVWYPEGVAVDDAGNIYVSDSQNRRIRKVDHATGLISTIAGTGDAGFNGDGIPANTAWISAPLALAVDAAGNVFFCDATGNRVRKLTPAGTGVADSAPAMPRIQAYPSPASDALHLIGPSLRVGMSITLLDLCGRSILTERAVRDGACQLDVSGLPEGCYAISFEQGAAPLRVTVAR